MKLRQVRPDDSSLGAKLPEALNGALIAFQRTVHGLLRSIIITKPLQVYLDDADLERLEAFARDRGWTKSQAIRAAIRALTRHPESEPVLELSGDIDGLPPDLSREFDRNAKLRRVAGTINAAAGFELSRD